MSTILVITCVQMRIPSFELDKIKNWRKPHVRSQHLFSLTIIKNINYIINGYNK